MITVIRMAVSLKGSAEDATKQIAMKLSIQNPVQGSVVFNHAPIVLEIETRNASLSSMTKSSLQLSACVRVHLTRI